MRSDKELLGIQNWVVQEAEGVDFLGNAVEKFNLTDEEIDYIRSLGEAAGGENVNNSN